MPHYTLDCGTYYLRDDTPELITGDERGRILHAIPDGRGIGIAYAKGEMWSVLKHGDPNIAKSYMEESNKRLSNIIDDFDNSGMKLFYIEIRPDGPILDTFNHTIQCTGRIKKFLEEEYKETFEVKRVNDERR